MTICDKPVFIIGSPRSGTTILARSLAEHSELWASEESEFLFDLFPDEKLGKCYTKVYNRPNPSWLRAEQVGYAEFLESLGHGINRLFTSRSRGRRWVEQTPQYGLIAKELAVMFPGAYFLHILRDGRKVVRSMINVTRKFSAAEREARKALGYLPPWPADLRSACMAWRCSVERAMQFAADNPARCLTVRNENLGADPDAEFARVFEFIGVRHEDKPIEFVKNNRINSSFQDVRGGGAERSATGPGPGAQAFASSRCESDPWDEWTMEQKLVFLGEAAQAMFRFGLAVPMELALSAPVAAGGEYAQSLQLLRTSACSVIPYDATVVVISKGEEELLNLQGRRAWHFPRQADGTYAGYHPEHDQEAITHLADLRGRGANYLLIPRTSFWWLDHYAGFRDHISSHYARVLADNDCIVYSLSPEG